MIFQVATAMVVCTILSAPIMYVSAWTLTISFMDFLFYKSEVAVVGRDMSIIGLLTSVSWNSFIYHHTCHVDGLSRSARLCFLNASPSTAFFIV